MITIQFKYYDSKRELWCEDDFEVEDSFSEFLNWLKDEEIDRYEILEIMVDFLKIH